MTVAFSMEAAVGKRCCGKGLASEMDCSSRIQLKIKSARLKYAAVRWV